MNTAKFFGIMAIVGGVVVPVNAFADSASAAGGNVLTTSDTRARNTVHKQVMVPGEDRFSPFQLTVRAGEVVEWENDDTDDHTVVSLDLGNTSGPRNVDHVIPGTDNNGGKPGTLRIRFTRRGTFTYYCRFHSHLDSSNQPAAPGPDGGIKDPSGNYGTPMMGIIIVR